MASNKILGRDTVELLCSLINKVANVSDYIDDINIKTDGTFSSHKIDLIINELKEEYKDYTNEEIAKVRNTAIKIVNDIAEIVDEGVIYLYKTDDESVYSRYMVIEGVVTPIDNITINLSDYYTKDEIKNIIGEETLDTTATTLKGAINEIVEAIGNSKLHVQMTNTEYEALTDEEKADGTVRFITDKNIIIIDNVKYGGNSDGGKGINIYDDYSSFPTTIEEDTIVYAKNNYINVDGTTKLAGLYLANADANDYILLISSSDKVDWSDGINSKPFEKINFNHFEVDENGILGINSNIHDTINTKLESFEKAIEKTATINDEASDDSNVWSAKKVIEELTKKGSKDAEHIHDNMNVLKKFGEDETTGLPTYDGGSFMTTGVYDVDNDGIVDKAKESEKLKDVIATATEINYLSGATSNIQAQIDAITSGVIFKGEFATFADMIAQFTGDNAPEKGYWVYIQKDETHEDQENVQYVYDGTKWVYGGGRNTVGDATDGSKGVIKLTGDLAGTSDSPQLKEVTTAQTVSYIKGMEIDEKGRVLSITEDTTLEQRLAKLEARPQVYVGGERPENMISGDIWVQI